jgi:chromosome segregation ATPase
LIFASPPDASRRFFKKTFAMEARTMQKDKDNATNNNMSKSNESQAERLLAKAEEQRQKLENATEEEAKQILQEAEETDKEIEDARKHLLEELAKALEEYKREDAKVKKLQAEIELLQKASKEAKATTSAVLEAVANLQNAFYDCQNQMSEIATIKEQIKELAKEFADVKSQIAEERKAYKQKQLQTDKEIAKIKRWLYVAIAVGVLAWIMK